MDASDIEQITQQTYLVDQTHPAMYRSVAHTSQVDESLFGKDSGRNGTMTKGRRTVTGPLAPSSIVISADELNRIRNGSVIKTEAEIAADKEHAERLKEEREKLSKERKDRMKELEKRSVMLAKKSDVEIAEIARNKAIRNMAEKKLDENADVVKLLNSMAQRATAFTIRDQQLEEKERLAKLEKEYDERLDVMIEIDRVQDIMKRENEEQYRKTKRVEDRKVINEQIAARERMRMLSLEAREQENQAMRNMMKRYEDEDRTQAAARAIEMEKSRKAVLLANADAIERKKQAREMEKKEMEDILIYQALKDQELARREEEEEAIARSKKERQAKLLAQQEKAQNNAGKMDELRARRAAEEKERNERKKEKAEALKRKQEMKILLESRAKQAADKLERQHSAKLLADEAVLMDMEYTRKMDERERREKAIKEARMEEHRVQLHAQIDERERRRRQTPEDNSGNIREELIREEAKLAVIRDQMVKDLVAQGVNPKYLSEMRNVDIGKILKR